VPSRLLRYAAPVELFSLAVLLVNLATVHWPAVASLFGPIHGCAYLFVIGATLREYGDASTRLLAFVPGIGGLLVIRRRAKDPATSEVDGIGAGVQPPER
jgi:hypothetical protein